MRSHSVSSPISQTALVAIACLLHTSHTSPAAASAAAYPDGAYAHVASERVVVVWDAAAKREHLLYAPVLGGDAREMGLLLGTPSVPTTGREDDARLERVAAKVTPALAGDATHAAPSHAGDVNANVRAPSYALATLRDEGALTAWLTASHLSDRAELRAWANRYFAKGWVVSAVHVTRPAPSTANANADAGAEPTVSPPVEIPPLRLSFGTPEPILPYAEPTADSKSRSEYVTRTGRVGVVTPPLHVWLVGADSMEAMQGEKLSGPYLHAASRIAASELSSALGDTSAWGFDARARAGWTVTYLSQFDDRNATDDVRFDSARVLKPVDLQLASTAPAAPTANATKHASVRPWHDRRWRLGLGAALLIALVAWVVIREGRAPQNAS